jgi:hypothetical protein
VNNNVSDAIKVDQKLGQKKPGVLEKDKPGKDYFRENTYYTIIELY